MCGKIDNFLHYHGAEMWKNDADEKRNVKNVENSESCRRTFLNFNCANFKGVGLKITRSFLSVVVNEALFIFIDW